MKSKRKLLEELCTKIEVVHHSTFACLCKFPSGRKMLVRTSLSYPDALKYARWFVENNFCDCLIVRPYDVKLKNDKDGFDFVHTLYDNVVEEIKDLPF